MKKSTLIKSFSLLSLVFIFAACSKYEEGSKFTILTKKMRMVNTWTLTSYTYNGSSTTINGNLVWDLESDGKAIVTASGGGFSFSETGSWDFNSDKTKLLLTDGSGEIEEYTIVQLKNKDLKVSQTEDGDTEVWTFSGE